MEFWNLGTWPANAPALIVPGRGALTYGGLDVEAEQWKARLLQMAGGRRPMVVLEFATCPSAVAAYLGALRADLPLLLAEPGQFEPESPLHRRWQPEIRIARQGGAMVVLQPASSDRTNPEPHPDLKLLLPTSGSTGDPKLVRLTGRNLYSNAEAIVEYLAITPADRAITTLPLFYSYGMSVLNSYLAAGASLVLTELSVVEPAFWDAFRDHGATSLALVPHQFDLLERCGFAEMDLPKLRYITQAGGKLPADSVRRFSAIAAAAGWRLVVMYGQTEASPRISYVPPETLPDAGDTIGRPIPGGRLWLADEAGREIREAGLAGELVYEGPNVMMGYAENRADLARGPEIAELRTGDVAERTSDGQFRIVGRIKRFAKLYGLRLSLDQIELVLRKKGIPAHAVAIDDQLVILLYDSNSGAAARDVLASAFRLPEAAVHVGHLKETPLLASGKPDQKALRSKAAELLRVEAGAPEREVESIADVLKWATRRRAVGPTDSFASLGGDSLSYLQVQMALERRLGRAPDGWENMSLAQLEAQVPAARSLRSPADIDVLLRVAAITLVVAHHASYFPLYGGSWMLIMLMGYSAARFKLRLIREGCAFRLGHAMLYPILPLYFLVLLLYCLFDRPVPLSYFLLLGDYQIWTKGSLLQTYWFVSLYAQIVFILMLAALAPALRRWLGRTPWLAAAVALGLLLLLEVALYLPQGSIRAHIALRPLPHLAHQGLIECLPLFLVGWMLRLMKRGSQTLGTMLFGATTVAAFACVSPSSECVGFVLVTFLMLAFNPKIDLPSRLNHALQQLAAITLYVYLLHQILVYPFQQAHVSKLVSIVVLIPLSFAVSLAAKVGFALFDRVVLGLATTARRPEPEAT